MLKRAIVVVGMFVLTAGIAFAATDTEMNSTVGSSARTDITVTVNDAHTEAPSQIAEITLHGTNMSTTTDQSGTFRFADLETGTHTVIVRAEGYEASESRVEVTEEGASVQITLTPRQ